MNNTQTNARVPEEDGIETNVVELVRRCGNELVQIRRVIWLGYNLLSKMNKAMSSVNEGIDILARQKKRELSAEDDALEGGATS